MGCHNITTSFAKFPKSTRWNAVQTKVTYSKKLGRRERRMTLVQNSLGSPTGGGANQQIKSQTFLIGCSFILFLFGYLGALIKSSDHRALSSHHWTYKVTIGLSSLIGLWSPTYMYKYIVYIYRYVGLQSLMGLESLMVTSSPMVCSIPLYQSWIVWSCDAPKSDGL